MIYKFKYRAVNSFGESEFSEELDVAEGSYPQKSSNLRKVESESGESWITLEWDGSNDTELPVLGYILRVNDGVGGNDFSLVTTMYPNVRKYLVKNLATS